MLVRRLVAGALLGTLCALATPSHAGVAVGIVFVGHGDGRSAYRAGYDRGYEDGFDEGVRDARRHGHFDPDRAHAGRGYRHAYGPRRFFADGYRGGYRDGYGRGFRSVRNARHRHHGRHGWCGERHDSRGAYDRRDERSCDPRHERCDPRAWDRSSTREQHVDDEDDPDGWRR